MYIIELFKKLKKTKEPEIVIYEEPQKEEVLEDINTCNHNFMPIDSTKTVLACTKCGHVIKNTKIKFNSTDKNPFRLN